MAARGLDWPDLEQVNPRLIYVSVTPFGRTGPKAQYAESDLTLWTAGGPLDPHRDGSRVPLRVSLPQAYLHAGTDAAAGHCSRCTPATGPAAASTSTCRLRRA